MRRLAFEDRCADREAARDRYLADCMLDVVESGRQVTGNEAWEFGLLETFATLAIRHSVEVEHRPSSFHMPWAGGFRALSGVIRNRPHIYVRIA